MAKKWTGRMAWRASHRAMATPVGLCATAGANTTDAVDLFDLFDLSPITDLAVPCGNGTTRFRCMPLQAICRDGIGVD
jgi:hypothetical protein